MRAWEEGWTGSGGDARGVGGASVAMKVAYHALVGGLAGSSGGRTAHTGRVARWREVRWGVYLCS